MSYKIDEIDYSKNDYIDINNRLSRRARNNIGKTVEGIDSLEDDKKVQGEKNLELYGSELINNLKQINYTYEQLESYILAPVIKPIPTRKRTLGGLDDLGFPPPPTIRGKYKKK
ncbi:MAG: hypothetical protein ASQ68_gp25 [Yellowstone Lake virophage 6]|uniref:hypothetical protein n=1 Tax=Yellowstone Lake virophage 6 TaxID=1557034 RepID=UPI000535A196|nr:MAG: hypothetical protein ASQ68_gp25 [Yellowstone Lake virophage 6]AIW01915.1 MAG: hypothetical protein YSLV6_ORF25 [Yellowstone Lake virophage 6]